MRKGEKSTRLPGKNVSRWRALLVHSKLRHRFNLFTPSRSFIFFPYSFRWYFSLFLFFYFFSSGLVQIAADWWAKESTDSYNSPASISFFSSYFIHLNFPLGFRAFAYSSCICPLIGYLSRQRLTTLFPVALPLSLKSNTFVIYICSFVQIETKSFYDV